jgi:hypothetical protein
VLVLKRLYTAFPKWPADFAVMTKVKRIRGPIFPHVSALTAAVEAGRAKPPDLAARPGKLDVTRQATWGMSVDSKTPIQTLFDRLHIALEKMFRRTLSNPSSVQVAEMSVSLILKS